MLGDRFDPLIDRPTPKLVHVGGQDVPRPRFDPLSDPPTQKQVLPNKVKVTNVMLADRGWSP